MKNLVFACCIVASAAFAADPAKPADPNAKPADPAAAKPAEGAAANPMANWKPRLVTKKDTKGIDALYKECDDAMKKGDLEANAAAFDFPTFAITDKSDNTTMSDTWT